EVVLLLPGLLLAGDPYVPGHPGQLVAQRADRVADVLADLAGDVADRGGQLHLQVGQLVHAGLELLTALVGDREHLLALDHLVRAEALLLEPGQTRVDRAGRGGVDAEEAVLQQADHLVAVPRALLEQLEQVQPEPAVTENGTHSLSPLSSATSPETV